MADPEERDASLALRAARGNRLRTAVKWYRDNRRLHTGDPIAMAADALDAYLTDHAAGKDALLVCDTWEIADALNRRLHHKLASTGPTLTVARDQSVAPGDIVISRRNDPTINVHSASRHTSGTDQVRNGNRWRVAAVEVETNRVAVERLSDGARAVLDSEYLKQHVTLGYATTVHSAQGVTTDSCYAIVGEGSSRAMLYVAMTRGRHKNDAFLYQRLTNEADHEHSTPTYGEKVHAARRGNEYSAAQHFRMILAKDDRPRTVHAEAEQTDLRHSTDAVADLLDRQRKRCCARQTTWQAQRRADDGWLIGRDRMAAKEASLAAGRYAANEGVEL
jgi:hypothetical protein